MFEIFAVVFILLSVWEATKKSILTWWFGLVGVISYMIVFWNQNLYISFGLQFIFVIQNVFGILNWKKGFDKIKQKFNIISISIFATVSFLALFLIFDQFSDNPQPFLDSAVTTLSIIATHLLIIGKRQTWIFWMIVDLFYIILFYEQQLFLSSTLYILLFILSITGYLKWKNIK